MTTVQQGDQGLPSKVTFQEINIDLLHESKHNPRRHVDGPAMAQLVESIRKAGMLTPLRVRPNEKGFEIAAGHRRYRAAKLVPLKTVPCILGEMSDQVFMEFLTIENLQREDVHPLDEAKGYEALMAAPYKMKVETIAAKVGKSVKYIYDSKKLLDLTKEARDLFWGGLIDKGHAILLARLSRADQLKAIGSKSEMYGDGGVFEAEKGLPYESDVPETEQFKAVSVRELQAWIDDHVRFDRRVVDPMLFPETAEKIQAECQTTEMEVKKAVVPITYEFVLNEDTRDTGERTYTSRSWKRADGQDGSKTCEYAMLGCVVAGAHRGESFDVCVDKKVCVIHWKDDVKAAQARAKGQTAKATKADRKIDKSEQRREAEERRQDAARAQWKAASPAILKAVAERVKRLPTKATGLLADVVLSHLNDWGNSVTRAQKYLSRGKSADDLLRLAAFIGLFKEIDNDWTAPAKFPKRAKALGVDLSMILKDHAVQTSAWKKAKP